MLRISHILPIALVVSLAVWIAVIPNSIPRVLASTELKESQIDCAREPGNDAGQKIQHCLDALPTGGTADARNLTGEQIITHSIVLNKIGTVLQLGSNLNLTLADGVTLDIVANHVRIEGTGYTTVIRLGNRSAVRVGSSGHPLWGWRLERFALQPAAGKQPQAGLLLSNAREGIMSEISVSKFSGTAIDVDENCWSDRSIDAYVIENGIGYNFHGDNLNAWNIRGGLINSNRIGINFDLGVGKVQGFSISDGTQMEANSDTAIRLGSGVIQGLFLSEIYSELFKSERLIKTEPGSAALKVNLLSLTNSYVYSDESSPVFLSTRSQDIVNASISNVLVRHSVEQLPVAEASGANTTLLISECSSVSSSNESSQSLLSNHGARAATMRGGVLTH